MSWRNTITKPATESAAPAKSWRDSIVQPEKTLLEKAKELPANLAQAAGMAAEYAGKSLKGEISASEQLERLGTAARGAGDMVQAIGDLPARAIGALTGTYDGVGAKPTAQALARVGAADAESLAEKDSKYPGARAVGQIIPAVVIPGTGAGGIAAGGLLGSYGARVGDTGDAKLTDVLEDTALGLGTYGAFKGAAALRKAPQAVDAAKTGATGIAERLKSPGTAVQAKDTATQGAGLFDVAKAGAREEMKKVDLYGSGMVDVPRKILAGAKGAAKGVKEVRSFGREVDALRSGKVLPGEPPPGGGGFDPGSDLFMPGPSKTKDFVASQAGQLSGNIDPATYKRLLEMGVDDVIEAKNFDPSAAAKGMAGDLEGLQGAFETARTRAFAEGQAGARVAFDVTAAQGLTRSIDSKIVTAAADELMPSRTKKVLEVLRKDLDQGGGFKATGETIPRASATETFDRLQKARQTLDSEINWARDEKLGASERMLRELRGEIDGVLKTAPGKTEADKLFQKSIDVENGFFGATEFRGPDGRMAVDEFKLKRLLGDTDAAGRFANQIENAREYFSNPQLPQEVRDAQIAMLDRIDAARKRYGDKRTLEALRQSEGPTSPAVNAKAYLLNRAGLPADSIGQPANNLHSMAQYVEEFVHRALGKKFKDLSPAERQRFAQLYTWRKSNPQATPEQMQGAANRLLKVSP